MGAVASMHNRTIATVKRARGAFYTATVLNRPHAATTRDQCPLLHPHLPTQPPLTFAGGAMNEEDAGRPLNARQAGAPSFACPLPSTAFCGSEVVSFCSAAAASTNGLTTSIGSGKTTVELWVAPISVSVCR